MPFNFSRSFPPQVSATVTATVTISDAASGRVLTTVNSSRLFQRFVPAAAGPPGGVVQLDRHRRALLVNGDVFQGVGWYIGGGQFTYDFADVVDRLASRGVNMIMVYSFEKKRSEHVPTPAELTAFLTHCEAVGMFVIFDFMHWFEEYSFCAANITAGCNITDAEHRFTQMAQAGAASRALLGWYVCDDCCSLGGPDQAALSTMGYSKLKEIDKHHPTVGAVNCDDMARFSDASGNSILIDYNMQENYGTDLQTSHIGDGLGLSGADPGDAKLKAYPLDWEPVINCPWGESNWEFGPFSPQTMKATSWAGAVVGGTASMLYFDWNGDVSNDLPDWQLTVAAEQAGLEMDSIAPSLAAPVDGSVPQPTITVRSTSTTVDVSPPATPAGFVRAAVYREAPTRGTADCVHVVAVNAKPSSATCTFVLSGAGNHTAATQPLMWDTQLRHPEQVTLPISVVDGVSVFESVIGPTQAVIYRLGCDVETRAGNLPNPDFELPSSPGNVFGWGLSMHDANRDPRAAVHADTSRPAHGRIALRLVVPTSAPLTMPVSNAGATPGGCSDGDQGFQFFKANTSYEISFMARSSVLGMTLSVMSGSWTHYNSNYSAISLHNVTLGMQWMQINTSVTPTTPATSCFQVQAQGAIGMLWLDDFFVREGHVTASSLKSDDNHKTSDSGSPLLKMPSALDMKAMVTRSDPIWAWNMSDLASVPLIWPDAPFAGNGMVGAYVLMTHDGAVHIEISRADYYDVRLRRSKYFLDNSVMDTPRMPGGVLRLEPTSTAAADQFVTGSARVHLYNASIAVQLRTASGNVLHLNIAALASRPEVVVLRGSAVATLSARTQRFYNPAAYDCSPTCRTVTCNQTCDAYHPNPVSSCVNGSFLLSGAVGLCEQELLAGGGFATAWQRLKPNTLLVALSNSVPAGVRRNESSTVLAAKAIESARLAGEATLIQKRNLHQCKLLQSGWEDYPGVECP